MGKDKQNIQTACKQRRTKLWKRIKDILRTWPQHIRDLYSDKRTGQLKTFSPTPWTCYGRRELRDLLTHRKTQLEKKKWESERAEILKTSQSGTVT